ncbi:hypothetical protein PsYK624_168460 [Phanerochaete sordida]|uniref:Uncharacterized protein n=1 Tax=Phanerochaete sordida TaxID=48140 RepID=A0A9P3GS83_9APHY|nr:hypothetical protein PsYK624_168460 [Phanerochaete sordida]
MDTADEIAPYSRPLSAATLREIAGYDPHADADSDIDRPPYIVAGDLSIENGAYLVFQRMFGAPHVRGSPLHVPSPDQAADRHDRDGQTGPVTLAGLVNIRGISLTILAIELLFSAKDGLLYFVDGSIHGCMGYGRTAYEIAFPYDDSVGSPFLFPEEQLTFRQIIHFWRTRNINGEHDERIARLDFLLNFRSACSSDEHVRRLRNSLRLGNVGHARELISYEPWGRRCD